MLNGNITVEEKILYDNFAFDAKTDQITYDAKREYIPKTKEASNIQVTSLSMGMLELFEAISNYPLYQKGIISINYLLYQIFGTAEDFSQKLFAVTIKQDLLYDGERIKQTILLSFDAAKQEKIINDEVYGLCKEGYIEWVKIIGKDIETISKATWLYDVLGLNDNEISLLLGPKSFLSLYHFTFHEKLKIDHNCPQNPCGQELIFIQMQNQAITKSIGFENMKQFNQYFNPLSFPYEHSIEMSYYMKLLKPEHTDADYDNVKLSSPQFEKLFLEKSDGFILNTENAINLLEFNSTDNFYLAYSFFLVKSIKQMNFITNYFFDFLPQNLLFGEIKNGGKPFNIKPLSKGYISLIQQIINTTYGKLYKDYYFSNLLYSKLLYKLIKNSKVTQICSKILQLALGDHIRVRRICLMKEYNMQNEEGLRNWIHAFLCKIDHCKSGFIEEMKTNLELTDKEIDTIYQEDYLGEYLIPAHKEIVSKYGCTNSCSNEDLSFRQYTKCEITKSPPDTIKDSAANSVHSWDKEAFPQEFEILFFQQKEKCSVNDCNDDSYKALLTLNQLSENFFSPDHAQKFKNKNTFEILHSYLIEGIEQPSLSKDFKIDNIKNYFQVLNSMITTIIIKGQTKSDYQAEDILYGNNTEKEANFLDLFRRGSPIENYKPTMEKLTGIIPTKEELVYPTSHTIQTSQNDKTQILRRLIKINQSPFISVNKFEYSITKKQMVPIHTSLYNFHVINKDQWINDGFQYDGQLETIYYYDELSSRVLRFDYKQKKRIDNLFCYEYVLNNNITQGIKENEDIINTTMGQVSQKFNKPFVISSVEAFQTKYEDNSTDYRQSTICVDPYSNMVIESNINLIYWIHSKKYHILNSLLKENEMQPLLYYRRIYSISDQKTYDDVFEGVTSYFDWRLALIIIGCGAIAGLFALGVLFLIRFKKLFPERTSDMRETSLLPD